MNCMKNQIWTVIVALSVGLVLAWPGAANAIGMGAALLPADTTESLYHPDLWDGASLPGFSTYSGDLSADNFTLFETLASPFQSPDGHGGVLRSQAWQHDTDGHMLFLYQVELNAGSAYIARGSIFGYDQFGITDAGIMDSGFDDGDIVLLKRSAGAPGQVNLYFSYRREGDVIGDNSISSWFYLETDARMYGAAGWASFIGGGAAIGDVSALVPTELVPAEGHMPEPLTVIGIFLGVGGVAGYARRRIGKLGNSRS